MSEIPESAVEAAANGLWNHRELHMVGQGYECYCGERVIEGQAIAPSKVAHGKHQATAALLAAQPAWEAWLREKVAQEIEAVSDELALSENGPGEPAYYGGMQHAANMVRGQ